MLRFRQPAELSVVFLSCLLLLEAGPVYTLYILIIILILKDVKDEKM